MIKYREKKRKKTKSIFPKFTPPQKIKILFALSFLYFILLFLIQATAPKVASMLSKLSVSFSDSPSKETKTEKKSKLIIEESEPAPFIIDKKKFPAKLDHRLLYEEIEHGASYIEQTSFSNVVHFIATLTQKEIIKEVKKQRQEEVITQEHFDFAPKHVTGRFVKFTGSLISLSKKTSIPKNEWELHEMWEGQIMDPHYNVISFQVLDKPVNLDPNIDNVVIYGIFFKVWTYQKSKKTRLTPLVIGRKLIKLD